MKNLGTQSTAISVNPDIAQQALYHFVISLYAFVAVVAIAVQASQVA